MPVSNGKFSKPIRLKEDLANFFGLTANLGYIIANGNINKWSKRKPINYPKLSALSENEFKGTTADNLNGIFYGIRVASLAGKFYDLHNFTFEYAGRPKGGTDSPYRLLDFNGYDHNAVCTLNGTIPTKAYFNVDRNMGCQVFYDYSGSNTTGIDYAEIINVDTDATKFEDYYPCIMINGYARGLFNGNTNTQTPLKYNDAWQQAFYVNFDGFPNQINGDYMCTLFLLRELYIAGITDLRSWQDVENTQNARQAFAVPEATGVICNITNYRKYALLEAYSCLRTPTGVTINLKFTEGEPTEDTTYEIKTILPGPATKEYTYKTTGGVLPVIIFTWGNFGLVTAPSENTTIEGSITCNNEFISSFNFIV